MPTVFITGATGFVGRALCIKMLENGWRVLGAFRKNGSGGNLPAGVEGVKIEAIEDYDGGYKDLERVDVVIHLAGRAHVMNGAAIDRIDLFRRINVFGTERLARTAAKAGVKRFIFISSVKVNGESSRLPCAEKDVPMPGDPYGVSKYEAEQALKRVSNETGLKIVILRPPLVYGAGVKANFGSLIKLVRAWIPLPLGGINNRRSFIYIGNLVDAIFICAIHPKAEGETFMVSDCKDVSTPELIRLIAYAMGKKVVLFSLPSTLLIALAKVAGKGEIAERLTNSLFVDTSKIKELLGWEPPFTIEKGIEENVKQ